MKCGREIPAGSVFCEDCLADMEKYPVKPGTVVNIPVQPRQPVKRTERHPVHTPEQRVKTLTKRVRAMGFALTLSVTLLIGAGALLFSMIRDGETASVLGQNYSTVEDPSETEGTTESTASGGVSRGTIKDLP